MRSDNLKRLLLHATVASVIALSGSLTIATPAATVQAVEVTGTLTVTAGSLWTYSSPDWNARAQVVNAGATFTIAERITVAGRAMYRLTTGFYITANPTYVNAEETPVVSVPAPAPVVTKTTTVNLNLRSGPGTQHSILVTMPSGSTVDVLESADGWDKVRFGDRIGWASASFLSTASSLAPPDAPAPPAPEEPVNPPMVETVMKSTTHNLNLRSGPGTGFQRLLTIPQGALVEVLESSGGWDKVRYQGTEGWASATYLVLQTATPTDPPPVEAPAPAPAPVAVGSFKSTTHSLNLRSGPNTSFERILTMPQGSRVHILETQAGWDKVVYDGIVGWASSTYLAALPSDVTGTDIISFASTLLGIPYTWGGNTPEQGFDCSGYVRYIYAQFGVALPRTSSSQAGAGIAVSMEELRPGDILYFGNNGSVNHTALYVGGNRMIHAPSPGKFVEIIDMTWHVRNYQNVGARRILE